MGELSEEHRGKMAHRAEATGLGLHVGFEGVELDYSVRDGVEHLLEDDHIGPDWCGFFIPPPEWQALQFNPSPHFRSNSRSAEGRL